MAKELRPAEHPGDLGDRLDLHLRAGPAAVARVVVGIDGHGQRVGGARHRMRRLEHLAGIERMEVGVVVAQPARRLSRIRAIAAESAAGSEAGERRAMRQTAASSSSVARIKQIGDRIVGHGDLSR